jgi:hypothetical protein
MIAWNYLNKKSATINALSDYMNMAKIIDITPDEIKFLEDGMYKINSSSIDGLSKSHDNKGDEVLCKTIDKIDVLKERYRQAKEFMTWFEPAWNMLKEEDKILLSEFYFKDQSKTRSYANLVEKLCYSERNLRIIKDKVTDKLSKLLFG